MLHEILLSLSGHHSPLWDQIESEDVQDDGKPPLFSVAPPEKAMLATLASHTKLHIKIRDQAAQISASHPSMVCRAVASMISSKHLKDFRKKIIEVEASILTKDAVYVGAYDIVPLSTIVGEFAPWARRLEWLWEVVKYIQSSTDSISRHDTHTSGAKLIDFLEQEGYTGYTDLEEMAISLLTTAESAWLRQVSTWVLYGTLSTYGAEDFFIQKGQTSQIAGVTGCEVEQKLVPKFVSTSTSASILAIGNALNQIRYQSDAAPRLAGSTKADAVMKLLPQHLQHLTSLKYPLSSAAFSAAVSAIKLSISQNALSQLLPSPKVLEILEVTHQFMLLGRGEFATSLIRHADHQIASRHQSQRPANPVRTAGRLDNLTIKEAEVTTILKHTWSELAALQADEDEEDEVFEKARDLLRLELVAADKEDNRTVSNILPSKTLLSLSIPPTSPINLFLSPDDIKNLSSINAYLLSVRRAELHLSDLWKLTSSRRCHPHPLGPPMSATRAGQVKLERQRKQNDMRMKQMRRYWATTGKAVFVLNELDAYLHGELIKNSWTQLRNWIEDLRSDRPSSRGSRSSRPPTASSSEGEKPASDPATLAQGHRTYLKALRAALLLDNADYVSQLRDLLKLIDHYAALFSRLEVAQQGLDLRDDGGVMDVLSSFAKDEKEIMEEMERSRDALEESMQAFVEVVRYVGPTMMAKEEDRSLDGIGEMDFIGTKFVPWRSRTVDRFLMRLELLSGDERGLGGRREFDDEDD